MVENTHKVGSKSKIGAIFMFFYLQVLWVTVSVEESEEYTMDDWEHVQGLKHVLSTPTCTSTRTRVPRDWNMFHYWEIDQYCNMFQHWNMFQDRIMLEY